MQISSSLPSSPGSEARRKSSMPPMAGYSGFLNRVAMPVYDRLRGRKYSSLRFFLEESQWWSPERLVEFQFGELQKLLKVAFDSVPFYQKKYAEAGVRFSDIKDISDLKRLPPLERDEIRNHLAELCNPAFSGKLLPHSTGGSSGSPTHFYRTRESYDWRTASTERSYAWTGATLGQRVLYLWGAPIGKRSFKQQLWANLYDGYRRQNKINTLVQPEGFWKDALRQAVDYQPAAIVAYTANIEEFCKAALVAGTKIKSLKSVVAAAEPVYPKLYDTVRDALGVPLFNTYGSREFMSIAVECDEHKGLHINSENILLENDHDISNSNELLVTDLHNFGMPFIRYRIGDSAPIDRSPCACGRGHYRLGKIDGRIMDLLRTRDGRLVPGELIPHVMKELPEVLRFQAQQLTLGHVVLRLVLSAELSDRSKNLVHSEMQKAFGEGTAVTIERVQEIPKQPSGKSRVVIGLEGS